MVLTLAARSSQQDLVRVCRDSLPHAGRGSRVLGCGLALSDRICGRRFPSGSGSGRDTTAGARSGGGDEPVNNRRDLGWLLFGNPVSAVGDDAGGHVPAAGFA